MNGKARILRHWLVELSREHGLVRYDARGNGLSDHGAEDLSLEAFVQDLETVTGNLTEERFDLVGLSQGCAVAIAFAARHPAKVRKLILYGGFPSGWRHHPSEEVQKQRQAMITLTEFGWGLNNSPFRQLFTILFFPKAPPEAADWFNDLQRVSPSPREAQRLQLAGDEFDVRDLLGAVKAPTIVFTAATMRFSFANGTPSATGIPGVEFVGLDMRTTPA